MTISADAIYALNHMNSTAVKFQLGQLIADAESIVASEIALADGKILVGNSSGVAAAVTMSGDVTITNAGVAAIASGIIVNADISASAAIDYSKLATLTSGNVLVGSSGNVATSVALSGDVTVSNAGVTAIGAGKVTLAMNAAAVVKEATGTLTQANLVAIGTPISLIAAGGAGTAHIVDEIEFFHSYSTTQYATGADVQFEYETSGDNIALVDSTAVTAATSNTFIIKPSVYDLDASTGTAKGFDITSNANKGIFVSGSNFSNGNVANVVKWRIRYHTVTLLT